MTHNEYLSSVYETRRANLRKLCEEAGGLTKFSASIRFSQSWLSQMLRSPFTEKAARKLEELTGLKYGTLDTPVTGRKKV